MPGATWNSSAGRRRRPARRPTCRSAPARTAASARTARACGICAQHRPGVSCARELARGRDRLGAAALHARRRPQEVDVVRVVHHRVDALRLLALRCTARRPRWRAGWLRPRRRSGRRACRRAPACARGGRRRAPGRQPLGARQRPLRVRRRLDGVDVVVVRARVVGLLREHALERRRRSPSCRAAAGRRASRGPTAAGPSATRRTAWRRRGRRGAAAPRSRIASA